MDPKSEPQPSDHRRDKRPRLSDGIVNLVGSAENSRIGDLLFSRLSAVDHVTWFGLQWAIRLDHATADEASRTATVAVGADGVQVSAIGFYLVRALRIAATARFELMGWNDAQWQTDARRALDLEQIFAETVMRADTTSA